MTDSWWSARTFSPGWRTGKGGGCPSRQKTPSAPCCPSSHQSWEQPTCSCAPSHLLWGNNVIFVMPASILHPRLNLLSHWAEGTEHWAGSGLSPVSPGSADSRSCNFGQAGFQVVSRWWYMLPAIDHGTTWAALCMAQQIPSLWFSKLLSIQSHPAGFDLPTACRYPTPV